MIGDENCCTQGRSETSQTENYSCENHAKYVRSLDITGVIMRKVMSKLKIDDFLNPLEN